MKYKLKQDTDKKLREQFYLSLFFTLIIWGLMAVLFYGDENPQTLLIYLVGSVVILPYLYLRKVKPYFENLTDNVNSAYVKIVDNMIVFKHFENLKKYNQDQIEIDIADIVNVKKAFRKDDSVNKVTLTLKDKSKIVLENFEKMTELLEEIYTKSEAVYGQSQEHKPD